jgi:parallel beta-helix repeat protein
MKNNAILALDLLFHRNKFYGSTCMSRNIVTLTIVLGLLLSAVGAAMLHDGAEAFFQPFPELPEPIYIRSDGSVEPSTAPIQQVGNTYTLTGNINNTIEVQRSDIVLDGNSYVITKPSVNTQDLMIPVGWLPGIRITELSNITVNNVVFEDCITGVRVENSTNIIIRNNTISAAEKTGIAVFSSTNLKIVNNNIILSNQSFTGMDFSPSNPDAPISCQIELYDNTITGSSKQVPATPPQPNQYGIWGGFFDSKMIGNSLSRIEGIALYYTGSNNLIAGNNFQENYQGILFTGTSGNSANNTFYGNNFNQNSEGVIVPWIRNVPENRWDNGTMGNYWSDYTVWI